MFAPRLSDRHQNSLSAPPAQSSHRSNTVRFAPSTTVMADRGWHYDPREIHTFSEEEYVSTLGYLDRVIASNWDPAPQQVAPGGFQLVGEASQNIWFIPSTIVMADRGWHYDPREIHTFSEEEYVSTLGYLDRVIVSNWDPAPQQVALGSFQLVGNYGKASLNICFLQCLTREPLQLVAEVTAHGNEHRDYGCIPEVCQQPQHGYTGFTTTTMDTFASGANPEVPAPIHVPTGGKLLRSQC